MPPSDPKSPHRDPAPTPPRSRRCATGAAPGFRTRRPWIGLLPALLFASTAWGEWNVFLRDDPMEDRVFHNAVTLARAAEHDDVRALVVFCPVQPQLVELVEIHLDFFGSEDGSGPVVVSGAPGSTQEFRVRWDEEPPVRLPFFVHRSGDKLMPGDSFDEIDAFIERVLAHDRLLLEVDLVAEGVELFEFSLVGAEEAISEARRGCLG